MAATLMRHAKIVFMMMILCGLSLRAAPPAHAAPLGEPVPDEECLSILEVIQSDPKFSLADEILEYYGLAERFANPAITITFFVPTNAAFERKFVQLGVSGYEEIPLDLAVSLINHHILPYEAVDSSTLLRTGSPPQREVGLWETVANGYYGPVVPFILASETSNGTITINGGSNTADVVSSDIEACGSLVHAIDYVLVPADDNSPLPPLGEPVPDEED